MFCFCSFFEVGWVLWDVATCAVGRCAQKSHPGGGPGGRLGSLVIRCLLVQLAPDPVGCVYFTPDFRPCGSLS